MTTLLTQNKKMHKSSGAKYRVFDFAIPAYQARSGLKTCPLAGTCKNGCYAKQGPYTWTSTQDAFENRLATILDGSFEVKMKLEITTKLKTASKRGQQLVIRIHSSGDMFSLDYLKQWLAVIEAFPTVQFYSYTKMVPLFKKYGELPPNFTVIFSEGGIADAQITEGDRHARVFDSLESLLEAGYDNAMEDDTVAFTSQSGKIGLYYHGAQSKQWTTAV